MWVTHLAGGEVIKDRGGSSYNKKTQKRELSERERKKEKLKQ